MVHLFQLLTLLKQNGHNNAVYENDNLPPGMTNTVTLVDKVVSLVALQQLQIHSEKELAQRSSFTGSVTEQQVRNEVRLGIQPFSRGLRSVVVVMGVASAANKPNLKCPLAPLS